MGVYGRRSAKSLLDEYLTRRIRYMVVSADDVRYAHEVVVEDYGEVEYRLGERFGDDEVPELGGIEFDISADDVMEADFLVRIAEADDVRAPRRFALSFLSVLRLRIGRRGFWSRLFMRYIAEILESHHHEPCVDQVHACVLRTANIKRDGKPFFFEGGIDELRLS